jgi:S-adenosylmethionine-diacylglycerol 3-amino-3-carboxypropyl transferase
MCPRRRGIAVGGSLEWWNDPAKGICALLASLPGTVEVHAMTDAVPSWVLEAAAWPVAFAQVREDPLLDLWVVEQLGRGARVMLVASGGCTAALLAGSPNVASLHLVDANPTQLALTQLKLRLLQTSDPATRLALLGHAPLPVAERKERLAAEWRALKLPANVLGPAAHVARVGPDYAGRYERVFAALQQALAGQAEDLRALLSLRDLAEQQRRAAPDTALGRALDEALDTAMALPNLVRLFGEEATKNPVEPFSRHFARRIRHALATLPAASNPYLWQMLLGRYPEGCVCPWLTQPTPAHIPEVVYSMLFMAEALRTASASFDFVHLSNILDWLSPDKAAATLELAWRALRPGGWTLIRQLNSTLDIPRLGRMFDWLTTEADDLHARDRSFFYRGLHLGRKP